jgi:predicted lipoprotein
MKQLPKYVVAGAIIGFLVYYSVSFERLDDVREQRQKEAFNPSAYARDFWDRQLLSVLDQAVDVNELIELFNTNMNEAIQRYGKAPGVSRRYAYLVKGRGTILTTGEDSLTVSVREPQATPEIKIMLGFYIPGNAVRDASGRIDVSQFSDTMKFNEISREINKIVVDDVIRPFLHRKPGVGQTLKFFGATHVARDAAEETLFGQLVRSDSDAKEFQLVEVVPTRLDLE